jgi:hypothetical protein
MILVNKLLQRKRSKTARKASILISFRVRRDAHHGQFLRQVHALLDAVARTVDLREREGHDRQDAQMLIPK